MISTSEISVIIQGPIYEKFIDSVVADARKVFPDSEIILSTCEGFNYSSNLLDKIIESKDPGGYPIYDDPVVYNASNRQLVSTLAGLKLATRQYALKMRSDMYFENTNFLDYMYKFPKRTDDYKILKERVILSTRYAPNPKWVPLPFHPSDWFFFGLKEDLLKIFESPLCEEPATSRYFQYHSRPNLKYDTWLPVYSQYRPEQYIWYMFIKRYTDIVCEHSFDISHNNIEKSEQIFANNAILLDANKIRYNSYKFNNLHTDFDLTFMYTHGEWLKMYKKYCDKNYSLPIIDQEKLRRLYLAFRRNSKIINNIKRLVW